METTQRWRRRAALPLIVSGVVLLPASAAWAAPPEPDRTSCVEQFNLAVGTPGEYQRVFHQDELGRDVSFFARLSEEDCPF
jgi:hypothetical protein